MKKGARFTTLVVALALVCGMVIGATASNGAAQLIQAYLTPGRTVKYNGEVQTMKDEKGNVIYPISYQGSTYLPIRAIAGLLDVPVEWDGDTQTVLLGAPAEGVDMIEGFKPYTSYKTDGMVQFVQNSDKKTANAGGVEISHWIGFWRGYTWQDKEHTTSFNLGGKYSTLTFKAYAASDVTLTVTGDNGQVLGEYQLVGGQVPQTFTVNLLNTTQLSFTRTAPEKSTGGCFIFDAFLK